MSHVNCVSHVIAPEMHAGRSQGVDCLLAEIAAPFALLKPRPEGSGPAMGDVRCVTCDV